MTLPHTNVLIWLFLAKVLVVLDDEKRHVISLMERVTFGELIKDVSAPACVRVRFIHIYQEDEFLTLTVDVMVRACACRAWLTLIYNIMRFVFAHVHACTLSLLSDSPHLFVE